MKYIKKLTTEEKVTLTEAYLNHPSKRVKKRAQAILLNDRKVIIEKIKDDFNVRHQTISGWLRDWESFGLLGLYDKKRTGRPTILTSVEKERFLIMVKKEKIKTRWVAEKITEETGKRISIDTVRRIIKKNEISCVIVRK